MTIQRNIILARFQQKSDNTIVIEGKTDTYTISSSTAETLKLNGDLLEDLSFDTILINSSGRQIELRSLISSWNQVEDVEVVLLHMNEGAEGTFNIGADDYITLSFSTQEPIMFSLGDYVDLNLILDDAQGKQFAKRYEICSFPKPTLNISTGGYDYELRLDAYYMKWKNKIFRYMAYDVEFGEEAHGEASWSLTAGLETHMAVFLRNLKSLGYQFNGEDYVTAIYNLDADPTEAKYITYSDTNLIDGLSQIADAYDCEWWVDNNIITFGKAEHSDYVQVEVGIEAESMSRSDSSGTFATRIYAFGSEKNLQSNYRKTTDEVLVNGVAQRRLMLPESVPYVDAWRYDASGERIYTTAYKLDGTNKVYVGDSGFSDLEGDIHICGYRVSVSRDSLGKVTLSHEYVSEEDYAQCERMAVDELVEGVISTEDIYPRTQDSVRKVSVYWKKFDKSEDNDSGEVIFDDIDPAFAGQTFDPDEYEKGLGGTEYIQCYYRIKSTFFKDSDGNENFDRDYIMSGETLSLVFNSGLLNGMNFEVMFLGASGDLKADYSSPDGTQWFELVANEDYGATMPSRTLYPTGGDEFTLYNWQAIDIETGELTPAAQEMITAAEWELLAFAIEYLWKTMVDDGVYECELNPAWVYAEGSQTQYVERTFAVGQRILLVNDALFAIPRESRVIGYKINLDIPYDHPTYKVGESVQYSRIGAVESKVNELTYNGLSYTLSAGSGGTSIYLIKTNDSVSPSDTNAFSALRSLNTFLRKDQDDTTSHNLKVEGVLRAVLKAIAEGGMQFGSTFETGLLGEGGYIDAQGVGELDALTLRKWLEVPELRYNRVTIMTGITWQTVGGGIIEEVTQYDDTTGKIKLKLEEGEIGAIALHDLCMGIFHFEDTSQNETEDVDDRNGNFKVAGFGTIYFMITKILNTSDNSEFEYQLREDTDSSASTYWGGRLHPQPYMDFACYANPSDEDRQSCKYTTTKYEIRLENMTEWTYGKDNYYYISGLLEGFTIGETSLHGTGTYGGNFYFSGTLMQIKNEPYSMTIESDLDFTLKEGETRVLTCKVERLYEDQTEKFTSWKVTRETGDSQADATWNANHTNLEKGVLTISYGGDDDVFGDSDYAHLHFMATNEDEGEEITKSCVVRKYVDGEDAYYISTNIDNIIFAEGETCAPVIEVKLYKGAEQIDMPGTQTGSSIGFSWVSSNVEGLSRNYFWTQSGGFYIIRIELFRDTVERELSTDQTFQITLENGLVFTKTIHISTVFDGADAAGICIDIEQTEIAIRGQASDERINVYIYKNNEVYKIAESEVKVDTSGIPNGYPFLFTFEGVNSNGRIEFNYTCMAFSKNYPLDAIIPVTFTIDGIAYVRNFHMYTVFDGDAAEKGDDAVTYELDCSVSIVKYQAAAGAFAPSSITASLYKVTGNYKEEYYGLIDIYAMYVGGEKWSEVTMDTESVTFAPHVNPTLGYPNQYKIVAETPQGEIEKIIIVESSYMPRVQVWNNIVEDDFQFESGQVGETFMDFVHYTEGEETGFFQCVKSHKKSEEKPIIGDTTAYWKPANTFDVVATQVLLAQTAKIDNLYVDDVYMEDKGGTTAIWMNPLFKGMKILNYGALEKYGRENQVNSSGEEQDWWANPSVWFHGDTIPSVQNIYGSTITGWVDGGFLDSFNFSLWNTPPSATEWTAVDFGVLGVKEIDTDVLSSQDVLSVTFLAGTTITFTRGTASRNEDCWRDSVIGISLDFADDAEESNIRRRNILFTQNLVVHNGYNGWNTEQTVTIPKGTTYTISVNGTAYFKYIRLVLEAGDSYWAYGADTLHVSENFSVALRIERKAYVSQYGSDGVMVGITSKNFFRLGINANNTMEHQMLSNGSGIILDASGPKQVVEQYTAPLGGLLLSGFLKVAGSDTASRVLSANFWTWDGEEPNITYNSVGDYTVMLPSSWLDSEALTVPISNTAIAVTCTMNTEGKVNAVAYITEISSDCAIRIHCKEISGSDADAWGGLYIQVTYVGNMIAKSASYGGSSTTTSLKSQSEDTIIN